MYEPRDRDPRILEDAVEWAREEFWSLSTALAELENDMKGDFHFNISEGLDPNKSTVNKYGDAPNGLQTSFTDLWDRADGSAGQQQIWLPPTVARKHELVSSLAADATGLTGAHTVKVYGLINWNTKEVSEEVIMDGVTPVLTVNDYVIVHRLKSTLWGSAGPNVGVITATAQTDGTITAQINAGQGQTMMCIYGIPSTQHAQVEQYYCSINKKNAAFGTVRLLQNPIPNIQLLGYLLKHRQGLNAQGTSHLGHPFIPQFRVNGPAIIKMQATADANDLDATAGFDLILVNN